jgi:hypothetical protein
MLFYPTFYTFHITNFLKHFVVKTFAETCNLYPPIYSYELFVSSRFVIPDQSTALSCQHE